MKNQLNLIVLIFLLSSCQKNKDASYEPNNSNTEIWAKQAISLTYFKIDSIPTDEQTWDRRSELIKKDKIVNMLFNGIKYEKFQVYDALFNEDSIITDKVKPKLEGLTLKDISHLAFKENWKFDTISLTMEKNVSAVCLFKNYKNSEGEIVGYVPLGWIKLNE